MANLTEFIESTGRPGIPTIVWSSDGRFVLYPGLKGLVATDTSSGDTIRILTQDAFTGLGVLPLTDA